MSPPGHAAPGAVTATPRRGSPRVNRVIQERGELVEHRVYPPVGRRIDSRGLRATDGSADLQDSVPSRLRGLPLEGGGHAFNGKGVGAARCRSDPGVMNDPGQPVDVAAGYRQMGGQHDVRRDRP